MVAKLPRVSSLLLHKVGVFEDLQVDFPPISSFERDKDRAEIHIFTGPNGCGKSTLLYAISDLFQHSMFGPTPAQIRFRDKDSFVEYRFDGGAFREGAAHLDGTMSMSHGTTPPLLGKFDTYSQSEYGTRQRFNGTGNSPELNAAVARYRAAQSSAGTSNFLSDTSFAVFAYAGQKHTADGSVVSIQAMNAAPFENALGFENSVRPHMLIQWVANKKAEAALAAAENDSVAAAEASDSLRRLTDFVAEICGLEVSFLLNRRPLSVSTRLDGKEVKFQILPDGLKSIIAWVADLIIRLEGVPWTNPRDPLKQAIILLLDEVDIYLHPKWQRKLLPALQRLLPNAQIFVATHSPFVVGSVEDASVYQLGSVGPDNALLVAQEGGAGKSFEAIVEDVFGVNERFDVETERMFANFYEERDNSLSKGAVTAELRKLAEQLCERGLEVELIVSRELMQVSSRLHGGG